jgi:hypothetical protein
MHPFSGAIALGMRKTMPVAFCRQQGEHLP